VELVRGKKGPGAGADLGHKLVGFLVEEDLGETETSLGAPARPPSSLSTNQPTHKPKTKIFLGLGDLGFRSVAKSTCGMHKALGSIPSHTRTGNGS
jgi:hypothetical protein